MTYDYVTMTLQHTLVRRTNAPSAGARVRGRLPSVQPRRRRRYLAGGSEDSAQFARPGPLVGGDQSSN